VVELLGSILALDRGHLPPTRNCDNPDPECPVHVHASGLKPVNRPYAVKLNFTDKGQVGVAVLKRWEG
jgi:3-oxoacyl-[acyl-carrier-protein] synthase II